MDKREHAARTRILLCCVMLCYAMLCEEEMPVLDYQSILHRARLPSRSVRSTYAVHHMYKQQQLEIENIIALEHSEFRSFSSNEVMAIAQCSVIA